MKTIKWKKGTYKKSKKEYFTFNSSKKKYPISVLEEEIEKRRNLYLYSSLKIHFNYPSDLTPMEYSADIMLRGEKIGFIKFSHIKLNHDNTLEIFDEKSEWYSIYNLMKVAGLLEKESILTFNNKEYKSIFILDRIKIKRKHKRLGLGRNALKNLIEYLKHNYSNNSVICGKSYPIQFENLSDEDLIPIDEKKYVAAFIKLEKFYEEMGFTLFGSSNTPLFCKKI